MLDRRPLTVSAIMRAFIAPISLTWMLTLLETGFTALIPLFIGFAIDGLLEGRQDDLLRLALLLGGLIVVAVIRRLYDTRIYGSIRVEAGKAQFDRRGDLPVSTLNARLGMGRELVDFLEVQVPALMDSSVQLLVSLIVLFAFHPLLAGAALVSAVTMIALYGLVHRRFYRLNADFNRQTERQVSLLSAGKRQGVLEHLTRLRRMEVRISDTEALIYGAIFTVLLAFILFNLWFAAARLEPSIGTIFSIVSYSWQFVEAALVAPMTLQDWSRLSEIMARINGAERSKN